MVWEKKIQLKEEARSEFEKQNEEVQKLKLEVQNKEVMLVFVCLGFWMSKPSPPGHSPGRVFCPPRQKRIFTKMQENPPEICPPGRSEILVGTQPSRPGEI